MSSTELEFVQAHAEAGASCPTCGQLVKAYRRTLTSTGARLLIALYLKAGPEFASVPALAKLHLRDVAHQGGYLTLGHHWGLIEEERRTREDGGRSGWWRLTQPGWQFVLGLSTIRQYVHVYDNEVLQFSGAPISIGVCLGEHFNYAELMAR